MPYGISQSQSDCTMWATVKETPSGAYETIGCHANKQDAIDHMVAASVNTNTDVLGQVDKRSSDEVRKAVDLSPPAYMRSAARRGVALHEEGKSGDGVRPQTVEDARKMAAGTVTEEKWRKIAPWIARHLSDLDNIKDGEITAGVVAHLLWGSNGTKSGAIKTMNYAQGIIDQLENEMNNTTDNRAATIDAGDGVVDERGIKICVDISIDDEAVMEEEVDTEDVADMPDDAEDMPMMEMDSQRSAISWASRSVDGKRTLAYSNIELRTIGNSNTLVGYAAIFDSPSEPLPWTEYVRRGAFQKTLKDGADVRLLIDHEGLPLARTKSGTLMLEEDDLGLRIEAPLDEANPDAARLLSALRRGDVSQMSFAFRTVKDAWTENRNVRELKEVQLFDVSVVTYPAYEETVAELRSRNNTESDTVKPIASLALRKRQIQLRKMQAEH
jgi:uncharacterized protein